ncbi:hypothetical protein [Salana multivorans]
MMTSPFPTGSPEEATCSTMPDGPPYSSAVGEPRSTPLDPFHQLGSGPGYRDQGERRDLALGPWPGRLGNQDPPE